MPYIKKAKYNARPGDYVELISVSWPAVIVEKDGNKFSVHESDLSETPIPKECPVRLEDTLGGLFGKGI